MWGSGETEACEMPPEVHEEVFQGKDRDMQA
jgi:hypothetical protein